MPADAQRRALRVIEDARRARPPAGAAAGADPVLRRLWTALGGEADRVDDLAVHRRGRYLPSTLEVDGLAVAAVGSALLAAADLAQARGARRPDVALDAAHVACAFASERQLLRSNRRVAASFAPLSRFARTEDGWIRLHANYEHHRRALLTALGVAEERALQAIALRRAEELEDAIVAAGGAAAAVRSPAAWAAHPQGRALADVPLVDWAPAPAAAPRRATERATPWRPAAGVRVLDLTRVIAGPVATRVLAALGAEVLRIDPPHLPELELGILDGCPGKRLTRLDLRTASGAATFHRLLAVSDVLVLGYRPGALAALGLDPERLAERHPHLVIASLSAWGHLGPWAERRGFDSLVQAACGIALLEGSPATPGALPVQALDHATGYLIAAAVLRELATRRNGREPGNVRLALAATATELMRLRARGASIDDPCCDCHRVALEHAGDILSLITPPGTLDDRPLHWVHAAQRGAARWWPRQRREVPWRQRDARRSTDKEHS